jgi:hypothetical protein
MVGLIATLVSPAGLQGVPLREDVSVMLVELSPLIGPALVVSCFASPGRQLERSVGARSPLGPLTMRRMAWGLTITAGLVVGPVCAGLVRIMPLDLIGCLARNGVFGAGLALLGAVLLPPLGSWCPVVSFGLVTWVFGSIDASGDPASWALPLQPWEAYSWTVTAIVTWVVGLVAYIARDGREG